MLSDTGLINRQQERSVILDKTDIVFLHPHFTLPGGAGNVVLESACRLDPEKYNVLILCIRADQSYKKQYPKISFVEIQGPLSDSLFFWLSFPYVQYKIHRVLNQLPSKVIIPQVLPSNWWAFIYKNFHREVSCLWYCHEPSAFIHSKKWIESIENRLMRYGARLLNPVLKGVDLFLARKGVDRIVSNSLFTKEMIKKIYDRNVSDHIYPGVDYNVFSPISGKKKYFFMLGRLTRFKNVDIAIKAMDKIQHKDFELIIGGEGEEKENLIALSQKLGLQNRVHFIGEVSSEALPGLYAEAKLVLCTSKNEPFGMVPVEALASGTPVIGHNSGGLRETVKHNHNGLLLDKLTPGSLQKAIDDLLENTEKYRTLQQNAGESVKQFDWDLHVKKLENILDELIDSDN